jgi:signal transduction histidine kinase
VKPASRLRSIQYFLGISVFLTVVSGFITVYNAAEKKEATDLVIHTYRVLWIGTDINLQLMEMESGQRGFLLTGDSLFLMPYFQAQAQLKRDLSQFDSLITLAEARAVLQQRLKPLIAQKQFVFSESFEQFANGGSTAAARFVASRQGFELMKDIQEAFAEIETFEKSALDARRGQLDFIYWANNLFQFISFGMIGLATLIAWNILRTKEQEIKHLVASLREWNIELERRVHERTLEISQANQKLRELNEEKDRFIGIASHDLKSPLAGITRLARLMRLEGVAEAQREYLDLIDQSCIRMEKLITDILNAKQAEQGVRIDKQKMTIGELWKLLDDEFGKQASAKSIELQLQPVMEDATVYTDSVLLFQVISNIVSNALKFSAGGSVVNVGYHQTDEYGQVSINDTGPGIKADELPLLFQKFRKLSARPTQGENSTGLGLSIAKLLADRLGLTIAVESMEGKGSTFRVKIPRSG